MLTKAVAAMSNIIALGYADINADDTPANARAVPGSIGFFVDQFGMKYCRYIKNVRGSAFVLGDVVRRIADITFTGPTGATTTSITKVGAFTANANIGKLLNYQTNAAAGVAPEGETAIISSNTADVLRLDATYPFSAVPGIAGGDSYRIYGPWHGDIAAGVVIAPDVLGCVIGANGISNGNFGWVLYHGLHPLTKVTAAGIAAGAQVVTGAGALATIGANAQGNVVGYNIGTVAATNSGKVPIMWTLGALGAPTNA